ncbi:hypothetical protein CXF38_09935, partial [Corynebacterium bovis]
RFLVRAEVDGRTVEIPTRSVVVARGLRPRMPAWATDPEIAATRPGSGCGDTVVSGTAFSCAPAGTGGDGFSRADGDVPPPGVSPSRARGGGRRRSRSGGRSRG